MQLLTSSSKIFSHFVSEFYVIGGGCPMFGDENKKTGYRGSGRTQLFVETGEQIFWAHFDLVQLHGDPGKRFCLMFIYCILRRLLGCYCSCPAASLKSWISKFEVNNQTDHPILPHTDVIYCLCPSDTNFWFFSQSRVYLGSHALWLHSRSNSFSFYPTRLGGHLLHYWAGIAKIVWSSLRRTTWYMIFEPELWSKCSKYRYRGSTRAHSLSFV